MEGVTVHHYWDGSTACERLTVSADFQNGVSQQG